jgi:GNAT superfamily N-acetyltransferase
MRAGLTGPFAFSVSLMSHIQHPEDSMNFTVRPIVETDFVAWSRLWRGYLEFYQTSVSEDVFKASFARMISAEHPSQNGFVAAEGDVLVGLVHYIYHPHNWRLENVCYLQDLFVDRDRRTKGVGRALIEAVYDAADANNTPNVYWLTQDFNTEARKLYDRVAVVTPFIKYNRSM